MAVDYRKIGFDSRFNYLKRNKYGSKSVNMTNTNTWYYISIPINIDYDAMVHVGANLTSTTAMWANNYVYPEMNGYSPSVPPQLEYYWTKNSIEIAIYSGNNTGTRTVWYAVYYDYGSV